MATDSSNIYVYRVPFLANRKEKDTHTLSTLYVHVQFL